MEYKINLEEIHIVNKLNPFLPINSINNHRKEITCTWNLLNILLTNSQHSCLIVETGIPKKLTWQSS